MGRWLPENLRRQRAERIIRWRKEGMGVQAIARREGIHSGIVSRTLKDAGVPTK